MHAELACWGEQGLPAGAVLAVIPSLLSIPESSLSLSGKGEPELEDGKEEDRLIIEVVAISKSSACSGVGGAVCIG